MFVYLFIIVLSTAIVGVLNALFNPSVASNPWYYYIIMSVVYTISLITVDAIVALVIRHLPSKFFSMDKRTYCLSSREKVFYEKIGVKKWKDKLPELGGFTSFHKDKIANPFDNQYIDRFILEACYGISIHYWSVPFGFLVILLDYKMYMGGSNLWWTMAIPLCCVNAVLVVLPAFILKYNLPKLKKIREHNLRVAPIEKSPK